jgi:hypothetical protein
MVGLRKQIEVGLDHLTHMLFEHDISQILNRRQVLSDEELNLSLGASGIGDGGTAEGPGAGGGGPAGGGLRGCLHFDPDCARVAGGSRTRSMNGGFRGGAGD